MKLAASLRAHRDACCDPELAALLGSAAAALVRQERTIHRLQRADVVAEIHRLRAAGLSLEAIGLAVGRHHSTVLWHLRRGGA